MNDTDATRKRHRVADPLREYAARIYGNAPFPRQNGKLDGFTRLMRIADEIDREHERRMDQARKDSRNHTCNYISRIVADYKRGKKWKRKDYPNG